MAHSSRTWVSLASTSAQFVCGKEAWRCCVQGATMSCLAADMAHAGGLHGGLVHCRVRARRSKVHRPGMRSQATQFPPTWPPVLTGGCVGHGLAPVRQPAGAVTGHASTDSQRVTVRAASCIRAATIANKARAPKQLTREMTPPAGRSASQAAHAQSLPRPLTTQAAYAQSPPLTAH